MIEIKNTGDIGGGSPESGAFRQREHRPEAPAVPRTIDRPDDAPRIGHIPRALPPDRIWTPRRPTDRPSASLVSGDGRRVTYNLPSGENVVAELQLTDDAAMAVGGEAEYRQIALTRRGPDGSVHRSTFWRTGTRDSAALEGPLGYPKGFFKPENLPGRTVDMATGDGTLVYELADKVGIHGVDAWLDERQRRSPHFSHGLAHYSGLPDESVDTVMMNYMMHELRREQGEEDPPSDYEKAIGAEASRILVPGGRAIIYPVFYYDVEYYREMAGDHFSVPRLRIGVNDPETERGPLILRKNDRPL